ncbi:MAG TPA: CoA transferase [Candidatus Binataceae bacterium]|nr:CoA transferase [Candidatus Binataceae bacterium]
MSLGNLRGALKDITVVEAGDEMGDYAAMLLGGLGATVIKLEPLAGSPSRAIGPFATDRDPEQSLYFWRYNLNKQSICIDLDNPAAADALTRLLGKADVVLMAGEYQAVARRRSILQRCMSGNRGAIECTITPFGLDGPYRDFKATDLTLMALGGIMAVCGYDPNDDGHYDTPPICPAMWHAYHIAGEYAAIAINAALNFRDLSGEGQLIDVSVHEAVNTCTEIAIPTYIYNGQTVLRQTARHAMPAVTQMRLVTTRDNILMLASISPFEREERALIQLLDQVGIEHVLGKPEYKELEKQDYRAALTYRNDLIEQVVASLPAEELLQRAQALGLAWSPIRRPEDNLADPHFAARGTFASIEHPELGRRLRYPGTVATDGSEPHFHYHRRAPRLGEHTAQVLSGAGVATAEIAALAAAGVIRIAEEGERRPSASRVQ